MTEAEQIRVDKLKARIATLKDQLKVARTKGKGVSASARGSTRAPRVISSKGRPRARARSARSGGAEASA